MKTLKSIKCVKCGKITSHSIIINKKTNKVIYRCCICGNLHCKTI